LEQRQARVKHLPGGWNQELQKLGRSSESDLPPGVREELKSFGLDKEGAPQLVQELNALNPAAIDSAIAALRAQVKADSASPGRPQPPDSADLERERVKARQLASSAGIGSKSR
jgi:hypothetical protein